MAASKEHKQAINYIYGRQVYEDVEQDETEPIMVRTTRPEGEKDHGRYQ
jgi:hypothetical protein